MKHSSLGRQSLTIRSQIWLPYDPQKHTLIGGWTNLIKIAIELHVKTVEFMGLQWVSTFLITEIWLGRDLPLYYILWLILYEILLCDLLMPMHYFIVQNSSNCKPTKRPSSLHQMYSM